MAQEEVVDRYVSYLNIDCYKKASDVIDCIYEATLNSKNEFWKAFKAKIPLAYFDKNPDEKVLYLVCSHVFYIEELFEATEFQKGIELLQGCEYDCC
ncbi:MAG: hypothetical protein RL154_325 [Pseudomonadota bacterium]|jgi:hypothetical protein